MLLKVFHSLKSIVSIAVFLLFVSGSTIAIAGSIQSVVNTPKEEKVNAAAELTSGSTPEDIDKILAQLSDEQVRQLLIKELTNQTQKRTSKQGNNNLTLIDKIDSFLSIATLRVKFVLCQMKNLPLEFKEIPNRLLGEGTVKDWLRKLFLAFFIFLPASGVFLWVRKKLNPLRSHFESAKAVDVGDKFIIAILRMLPEIISLLLFAVFSVGLFFGIFGTGQQPVRMVFLAVVIAIVLARTLIILAEIISSPGLPSFRLLNMSEEGSVRLYKSLCRIAWLLSILFVMSIVSRRIFASPDVAILMVLLFGTLFIGALGWEIWINRQHIAGVILSAGSGNLSDSSWFRNQIAKTWHFFAFTYLFFVWIIWAVRLVVYDPSFDGAFFISLLIVPIFFVLDRMGQWVVTAAIGDMFKGTENEDKQVANAGDTPNDAPSGSDQKTFEKDDRLESEPKLIILARRIVRAIIFFTMLFWLMNLWGFESTFGKALTRSAFHILLILTTALIFWRWLSAYIARKLEESLPEKQEEAEDEGEEEEWRTVALGRRHTLLPLLRKFAGTIIAVLTALLVLSSLGVNIGPLLAGAGVVGLAISFGAQKLVADILCGIFYLIDDAFRIGEYIEAGNVSGTVEGMTLRNVMLRHHRGMLQIVPFSDLGSITNYMRGGIVVKFNLKLPYDTDIDKVRKIIKKVGKKMLEDPELGPAFIKPIKSQGVREVGDSALTFRVKFTAKPGKQFLIRREAYRRITEALKAAGIEYAHPKVIVEIPNLSGITPNTSDVRNSAPTEPENRKIELEKETIAKEAGAAAGLIIKQQKKDKDSDKESDEKSFLDL